MAVVDPLLSVCVRNLPIHPLNELEELLYELFLQVGPLRRVYIPYDDKTSCHKGYGFVEFEHAESVLYACKALDGICLLGIYVGVVPANREKKDESEVTDSTRQAPVPSTAKPIPTMVSHPATPTPLEQLSMPPVPPPFPPPPLPPPPMLPPCSPWQQSPWPNTNPLPPPPPTSVLSLALSNNLSPQTPPTFPMFSMPSSTTSYPPTPNNPFCAPPPSATIAKPVIRNPFTLPESPSPASNDDARVNNMQVFDYNHRLSIASFTNSLQQYIDKLH